MEDEFESIAAFSKGLPALPEESPEPPLPAQRYRGGIVRVCGRQLLRGGDVLRFEFGVLAAWVGCSEGIGITHRRCSYSILT